MRPLAILAATVLMSLAAMADDAVPKPTLPEFRLWEGPAPGTAADAGNEVWDQSGRVRHVTVPTLTGYLPDPEKATGTAIIMVSGGGYAQLAPEKYARLGTGAFLPHGIAVFNLKYRLRPPSANPRADALADGKRAVRIIRLHAKEWHIDPNKIGLIGASAGANMILNLLSDPDEGKPDSPDLIERQDCTPNFAGLLSAWPGGQKITDFHFSVRTPIFLAHAEDDATAPVGFARTIEATCKAAGVPVHAEYVADGGHDAFGSLTGKHGDWTQHFLAWIDGK